MNKDSGVKFVTPALRSAFRAIQLEAAAWHIGVIFSTVKRARYGHHSRFLTSAVQSRRRGHHRFAKQHQTRFRGLPWSGQVEIYGCVARRFKIRTTRQLHEVIHDLVHCTLWIHFGWSLKDQQDVWTLWLHKKIVDRHRIGGFEEWLEGPTWMDTVRDPKSRAVRMAYSESVLLWTQRITVDGRLGNTHAMPVDPFPLAP